MKYAGRIVGTINDTFEIDADSPEEARDAALEAWQYVEYEDLEVDDVHEVKP